MSEFESRPLSTARGGSRYAKLLMARQWCWCTADIPLDEDPAKTAGGWDAHLATHLIKKSGHTHRTAHTGAVTLIQRFARH